MCAFWGGDPPGRAACARTRACVGETERGNKRREGEREREGRFGGRARGGWVGEGPSTLSLSPSFLPSPSLSLSSRVPRARVFRASPSARGRERGGEGREEEREREEEESSPARPPLRALHEPSLSFFLASLVPSLTPSATKPHATKRPSWARAAPPSWKASAPCPPAWPPRALRSSTRAPTARSATSSGENGDGKNTAAAEAWEASRTPGGACLSPSAILETLAIDSF